MDLSDIRCYFFYFDGVNIKQYAIHLFTTHVKIIIEFNGYLCIKRETVDFFALRMNQFQIL